MALSPEQLELRRHGITATDAAAIVGLSPWKSAADVWVEKKHPEVLAEMPVDKAKARRLKMGLLDEPMIARMYEEATGETLIDPPPPGTIAHPTFPWRMCTADKEILGKQKGVELKTTEIFDTYDWGDEHTDQIPAHYLIQITHTLMTYGWKEWDCAARIGLYDFKIYDIFYDNTLAALLHEAEEDFYRKCILGDKRPEFDWGENIRRYVLGKYPKENDEREDILLESGSGPVEQAFKTCLLALRDAKLKINEGEQAKEIQRTLLASMMEDAAVLKWMDERISVSYRLPKKQGVPKLDHKTLCTELLARWDAEPGLKEQVIRRHTRPRPAVRTLRVRDGKVKEREKDEDE